MEHLIDDMPLMMSELDSLRESGEINMFGAPRWLQDNYFLSKEEAAHVFKTWTEKFDEKS